MHDLLFESLRHGATVVTVNHRLARSLRSAYNLRQVDLGRRAWRTPAIASFDAWCDALWRDLVDAGAAGAAQLPGTEQEAALWERIVDESAEGHGLVQTHRTALQARDAWALAAAWRIEIPSESSLELNDDCRAFVRWASRYAREIAARGWVDRARLADRLVDALDGRIVEAPDVLWLAGFDELTPQQSALVDAVGRAGGRIERHEPIRHDASVTALALADTDDELRSAARWARDLLDRGGSGSIGIVVPGLQSLRTRVDAIFGDHLLPAAILPGSDVAARPYNISSGLPLASYPVVATALVALELCTGAVPIERTGAILRSPFVGGAEAELSQRALLDARLRRNGRTAVRAAEILALAAEPDRELADGTTEPRSHAAPDLARRLGEWERVCAEHEGSGRHRPSTWAAAFAAMLETLGWPGDRVVSSAEHQALEKWWELLATYATLDGVVADESATGAVRRLARMAASVDFQPRTDDAPVQILGSLEAAGMTFEHLWILGMHDEEMPATPKPNPFLPIRLQRAHRVARASAERELEFARIVVDGLLGSAPHVIVSHPLTDGERPLVPSPLIAHLGPQRPADLPWSQARVYSEIIHEAAAGDAGARETLADHTAPAIPAGVLVRGGTGILKDQAACAFRAFANHRLDARPLERAAPGLDPMERGRLMHAVLESLWKHLKSHAGLVRLGDAELDATIARHVERAVAATAKIHPETFSERFAAIERVRLAKITRQWLELERQRAPFRMVSIEKEQTITIGGIEMNVRVDRIDELSDGRKVFIDYKTSRPSSKKWFGERPEEPQLPIYCTTCDDVAAVLFVQLKADEVKFTGIVAEDGIVPGVKAFAGHEDDGIESWEQINPRWRQVLNGIGEEFMRGEAAVAPKHPTESCQYCQVGPLCRVRDAGGFIDDAEVTA